VLSIAGNYAPDKVTQEELKQISQLQAAEWLASQAAHKAIFAMLERLKAGAKVEEGKLYFDADLRMVRTKRKEEVG
jgi:hypothetical protein